MDCPKCNSKSKVKNGLIKDVQRYKCKSCGYNYTVTQKSTAKTPEERRMGLIMYLEGIGVHSIGRLLGVSHVAVINWIKKYGKQVQEIKNEKPVSIMEIDEMHTYVQSKKTTLGFGLRLIERENDTLISLSIAGETETGMKLWEINDKETDVYCTDFWKNYAEFIPEKKHLQTKSETFTVQNSNGRGRHHIARFRRRTKCYTKMKYMMVYSLQLLFFKLNNELSILNY